MKKQKKIIYTTKHPKIISKKWVKNNRKCHWWINHPTVMFRKKYILEVGAYSQKLHRHAEDIHLWIKLMKKDHNLYNLKDCSYI